MEYLRMVSAGFVTIQFVVVFSCGVLFRAALQCCRRAYSARKIHHLISIVSMDMRVTGEWVSFVDG